jgi:hypothetical protein
MSAGAEFDMEKRVTNPQSTASAKPGVRVGTRVSTDRIGETVRATTFR